MSPAPQAGERSTRRNVVVMSLAVFTLIAGEQLWSRFLPVYLLALGAPALALGLWGSSKDFLDAALQWPGGILSDRFGSQRALLVFTAIAGLGYLVYLVAPAWPWLFVGLLLAAAWTSLASPATFALVAESLPEGQRARGFLVQSVLRRVPIVFAPALGGALVQARGLEGGLKVGFAISAALALIALIFQRIFYVPPPPKPRPPTVSLARLWRVASAPLKRLLVADVLARSAESLADVFVVVYALDILHVSPLRYGAYVGLQMGVSIAAYFPGTWVSERFGRKRAVIFTLAMFAAFPLLTFFARDGIGLTLAFIAAGLREFGEPARKSLIVDSAPPELRGQAIGAYYFARSTLILPMGVAGGWLWLRDPHAPFAAAAIVGAIGVLWFALRFHERPAAVSPAA